jgi:hypothetical protein
MKTKVRKKKLTERQFVIETIKSLESNMTLFEMNGQKLAKELRRKYKIKRL